MRWFVRQSKKGGPFFAFNHSYRYEISDDVSKIISEEINVNGNVYDIVEAYMKDKNLYLKFIKKVYESKFNEYRDVDEEEMNNYINKKLGEIPIHKLLQELSLNDLLWHFDAVSFYPSAMSDPKSIFSRIETVYAFTPDINDKLSETLLIKFSHKEVLY